MQRQVPESPKTKAKSEKPEFNSLTQKKIKTQLDLEASAR